MLRKRVIPSLLLQNNLVVKGVNYKDFKYIGDPINIVKIFNTKEVDELIVCDVTKNLDNKINYDLLKKISDESYMPISYGGGINNITQIKKIFKIGFEKVILNKSIFQNNQLISEAIQFAGSQSVSLKIDLVKTENKYKLYNQQDYKFNDVDVFDYIKKLEKTSPGELIISFVDKDGTGKGFDIDFYQKISSIINIPILAHCGASCDNDVLQLFKNTQVSGCCVGSAFVYYGKNKSVLISYINRS
jgi:cyclase